MPTINLDGERIEIEVGQTLFEAADRSIHARQEIASSCPRAGQCRECLVEVRRGNEALSPPTASEAFLARPEDPNAPVFRLACQARVLQPDAVIEVETFKRHLRIVTEGRAVTCEMDPWVRQAASGTLWFGDELIGSCEGPIHGAAIDLGTTTVVVDIVDLATGRQVAQHAFENPQKYGGSDVMHRISYDARRPGQLHRTLIAHLNAAFRSSSVSPESIWAVAVAGNPTMRDLFFGLDVQTIGQKPYVSHTQIEYQAGRRPSTALWTDAANLGLATHPAARVYGLPIISNHVGADMAAVLGTLSEEQMAGSFMVVDIGTNTEVVAGKDGRLLCASCPAGPAFEGGRLGCGMPAADGAITELQRRDGTWRIAKIGDLPPRGLCGSGLVDILAELRTSGEMDALGRFRDRQPRIAVCESSNLFFTRQDGSELAQAKAANGVGQAVVLRRAGITVHQLDTFFLAGAFANKMNLENARRIGLILPVPNERIVRIGNASIEGTKAALLNRACRERIERLVPTIEHVELEQEPDFFELFVEMTKIEPIAR
ncbi:MAG: DUF4445 domain-containing protein [Phycisphaerae bacterium]|nr:DUF4445 domain-containing protein [Phycisphaerae bacterium]